VYLGPRLLSISPHFNRAFLLAWVVILLLFMISFFLFDTCGDFYDLIF
jgi:hypothetical protein